MATLGDEILRATGGPTVPDGLRAWYIAGGATSGTLDDLERQWLLVLTVEPANTTKTNGDLWMQFLSGTYSPGTLNDMQLKYWTAQP